MSQSLRDQLLGLGFKPPAAESPKRGDRAASPQPSKPSAAGSRPARLKQAAPAAAGSGVGNADARRKQAEVDLARAYALRAEQEKAERIAAEREKQEAARRKREAKAKVVELLKDRVLNAPEAEIARHFEYGGKIRRVYVTPEQLKALNAGELGVVQLDGRYLVVPGELLAQVEALLPSLVALKVDPTAPPADDPYADPKYRVPEDLVW